MKHYSEKELSLFYLQNEIVKTYSEDISTHLKECFSCRELYEEIKEFYEIAEGEKSLLSEGKTESLILSRPQISKSSKQSILSPLPHSFPQKLYYFALHKPIVAGTSLIAAALIIAFAFNWQYIFRDTKPNYFEYDEAHSILEVFNKKNEKLYGLHYTFWDSIMKLESLYKIKYSVLTDLDKDGKMEVVTIVPNINNINEPNYLKVFDESGILKFSRKVGRDIIYNGENYISDFPVLQGILVDDFDGDGKKEIFVGARHRNSPYLLSKFDDKGILVGEYWHYGHFWGMNEIDINNDGKKEIFLCGADDKVEKASFVIFDPLKMNRKDQQIFSDANDEAVIKEMTIDSKELDAKYNNKPRFLNLIIEDKNSFSIFYAYDNSSTYEGVDVTFDKSTFNFSVKPTDFMKQKFEFLRKDDSSITEYFSSIIK